MGGSSNCILRIDNFQKTVEFVNKIKKCQRATSGFTQAGVYARRQFCADIQVCSPLEHLWNPRLREAATTLHASLRTA